MSLFTATAFQPLFEQESRLLTSRLASVRGGVGLSLQPAALPAQPPLMRNWVHLRVRANGFADGHLRADCAELPFVDSSFDIVVIRHAAECVENPHSLVREALRVLAANGLLLVAGMRPFSLWSPWMMRQAHLSGLHFRPLSPASWRRWLAAADVNVSRIEGFGALTPWGGARGGHQGVAKPGILGAGFILVAHKRRTPMTGTRVVTSIRRVPATESLACLTRRRCA